MAWHACVLYLWTVVHLRTAWMKLPEFTPLPLRSSTSLPHIIFYFWIPGPQVLMHAHIVKQWQHSDRSSRHQLVREHDHGMPGCSPRRGWSAWRQKVLQSLLFFLAASGHGALTTINA